MGHVANFVAKNVFSIYMSILEIRFYLVQCFSRKVAQANMHTYVHTHINTNKEDMWPSGSNILG